MRTALDKKGRTALQAKIHPNRRLIQMNAEGQRMHTSMELDTNFAGTGKTYLMGLAVTDEPASLGTTALKFSKTDSPTLMISDSIELSSQVFSREDPAGLEKTEPKDPTESFFKSLFQKLGAELKSSELKNSETSAREADEMTDEQFNALKELHEKQLTATENLAILLQKGGDGDEDQDDQQEQSGEGGNGGESDGNGEEIRSFMTTVTDQLKTFGEKLEQATAGQQGTQIPPNTGSGADARFV